MAGTAWLSYAYALAVYAGGRRAYTRVGGMFFLNCWWRTLMVVSDNLSLPVLVRQLGWGEPMEDGNFVLPTGTVTLLLGDGEGSTQAWEARSDAMSAMVAGLNELVDEMVGRHDGVRPAEQGESDGFVAAFSRARDAVGCALALQRGRCRAFDSTDEPLPDSEAVSERSLRGA